MIPPSPTDRRRAARQAARAAVDAGTSPAESVGGRPPGPADPLSTVLRRAGVVRVLVLVLMPPDGSDEQPAYGSWLIERIREVSGGLVTVNPNTMYPLLRALEEEGLAEGEWEHPVRRSRRFYRITARGVAERERLRGEVLPALDEVVTAVAGLRRALAS